MSIELPNAKAIAPSDISRNEWLRLRTAYIGGSDAATVCGENPYSSRYRLWAEKTGKLESEDISDKPAVQWGNRMEPFILADFARHDKADLLPVEGMYVSNSHPFMAASLDGLTKFGDDFEIVEIKTAGWHQVERWDDGPPDNYRLQVMHYLAVTGAKRAHVHVMLGNPASEELWQVLQDEDSETVMAVLRSLGYRTETHVVERDEEMIESLITLETEFYELVKNNIEPDAESSDDMAGALGELHPVEEGKTVDVDESFLDLLQRRAVLKDAEKATAAELTKVENAIKLTLRECEIAKFNGEQVCTWKVTRKEARTVKYEASEYRVLRPTSIAKLEKAGLIK